MSAKNETRARGARSRGSGGALRGRTSTSMMSAMTPRAFGLRHGTGAGGCASTSRPSPEETCSSGWTRAARHALVGVPSSRDDRSSWVDSADIARRSRPLLPRARASHPRARPNASSACLRAARRDRPVAPRLALPRSRPLARTTVVCWANLKKPRCQARKILSRTRASRTRSRTRASRRRAAPAATGSTRTRTSSPPRPRPRSRRRRRRRRRRSPRAGRTTPPPRPPPPTARTTPARTPPRPPTRTPRRRPRRTTCVSPARTIHPSRRANVPTRTHSPRTRALSARDREIIFASTPNVASVPTSPSSSLRRRRVPTPPPQGSTHLLSPPPSPPPYTTHPVMTTGPLRF